MLASSGLWHEQTGSLHLAYRDDEAQVLREFAQECAEPRRAGRSARRRPGRRASGSREARRTQARALESSRGVRRPARGRAPACRTGSLARFGVDFQFRPRDHRGRRCRTLIAGDARWTADRLWICSGDELRLLFADQFQECGLVRCKLQMMRSQSYGAGWRIGPMLAAGLTLRHYASFRNCPSLPALKHRVARESPWLDRFGIHVLVSQNGRGELTIGDSHEYGDEIEPFDKTEIDEWILGYLKTFLDAPGSADCLAVARNVRQASRPSLMWSFIPRPA